MVAVCCLGAAAAYAGGTVAGCSEAALRAALSGGGVVKFASDCSITVTGTIGIGPGTTTIDAAGHQVILSGGGAVRQINVSGSLTLLGLTLANGQSPGGGALYVLSGGSVVASNCTFTGNQAVGAGGASGSNGSNNSSGNGGDGSSGTGGNTGAGGAIYNLGSVTLINCTLATNGVSGGSGGAGGNGGNGYFNGGNGGNGAGGAAGYGGAIYNQGTLVVSNCTFSGNTAAGGNGGAGGTTGAGAYVGRTGAGGGGAGGYGGAIYNAQSLFLNASTFSGNSVSGGTGAAGGTLVNGNGGTGASGADGCGGAICCVSWSVITNCTFYNNTAAGGVGGKGGNGYNGSWNAGNGGNGGNGLGGSLHNMSTMAAVNCTLSSGSAAGAAGGAAGSGTYAGSSGSSGVSGGGAVANGAGSFTLANTILAASVSGGNGYGSITDAGHNLSTDGSLPLSGTSMKNTDPKLGSPAMNGGLTATLALQSGSPAIDKIPSGAGPGTDQRGLPRPLNLLADIGAYEYEFASRPVITQQPMDQLVAMSNAANFSVAAVGATPLAYQWRFQGVAITNATATSYTVANATTSNEGPYDVVISNNVGSVTSAQASIHLFPAIKSQPASLAVPAGSNAIFSVAATGDPSLVYQWFFNLTNMLGGATNSSLTVTSAQTTNIGTYTVSITNSFGAATSAPALLNILPTILDRPADQTVMAGAPVNFNITATGTSPLTFQWRLNGAGISGATLAGYTNSSAQASNAGTYDVVVANSFGSATSAPARLTVLMTISGSVLLGTSGLPGVTVNLGTNHATTDSNGNYSANLSAGTYPVTPNHSNYLFQPATVTITLPPATNGVNFAAIPLYSISGRVTGLSNSTSLTLVGGGATNAVLTANDGSYTVSGLRSNSYTVLAPSIACYAFVPTSSTVAIGPRNAVGVNFSAAPDLYTISGRITDGLNGLSSVTVQAGSQSTNTDSNGNFVLAGLCPGSYVVTPTQACNVFNPRSLAVSVGPNAAGLSFIGLTNGIYKIQGQITVGGSNALEGVVVKVGNGLVSTDNDGHYSVPNLCPGVYTVTPVLGGFGFTPASRPVAIAGASSNSVNFVAVPLFILAGQVLEGGTNGLSGVSVTIAGVGTNVTLTTTNGNFAATGLVAGQYTVSPALPCYLFSPTNPVIIVGPTNATSVSFDANHDLHKISGRITQAGAGLANVAVQAGGQTATTDANGDYSLPGLCPGAYIVTPALACHWFNPPSQSLTLAPDVTGVDFVAGATSPLTVQGRITQGTNGLAGAAVTLGGAISLSDAAGNYVLTNVCPGANSLRPSLPGYKFSPSVLQVTLSGNTNGLNFQALPVLALAHTNGVARLFFAAAGGLGYRVEASANLLTWQNLFITNNPSTNPLSTVIFQLLDSDSTNYQKRFYRVGEFPWLNSQRESNTPVQLSFVASPGFTYSIERSSNLLQWEDLLTTNNASTDPMVLRFADPAVTNYPLGFYRIKRY